MYDLCLTGLAVCLLYLSGSLCVFSLSVVPFINTSFPLFLQASDLGSEKLFSPTAAKGKDVDHISIPFFQSLTLWIS